MKDPVRQRRWRAFVKEKKALMKVALEEVIEQSKKLLIPIVDSIEQNREFNRQWKSDKIEWS